MPEAQGFELLLNAATKYPNAFGLVIFGTVAYLAHQYLAKQYKQPKR